MKSVYSVVLDIYLFFHLIINMLVKLKVINGSDAGNEF